MTDEKIQEIVNELKGQIYDRFNLNTMDDEQLEQSIEDLMVPYLQAEYTTIEERVDISERVFSSIRGLGLLDTIIKDEQITEVMINGPDDIFIEKSGDRKSVV